MGYCCSDMCNWSYDEFKSVQVESPSEKLHSCSICEHFTCDPEDMCTVNPIVCSSRCEYHLPIGIFSCDLMVPCDKFAQDHTKLAGYVK